MENNQTLFKNKYQQNKDKDIIQHEITFLTDKLKNIENKLNIYSDSSDMRSSINSHHSHSFIDNASNYQHFQNDTDINTDTDTNTNKYKQNPYNLSFNKENMSSFKTKIRTESPSRKGKDNSN